MCWEIPVHCNSLHLNNSNPIQEYYILKFTIYSVNLSNKWLVDTYYSQVSFSMEVTLEQVQNKIPV